MIDLDKLRAMMPDMPSVPADVREALLMQYARVGITPLSIDVHNEPNAPSGSAVLIARYAGGIERFATYEPRT